MKRFFAIFISLVSFTALAAEKREIQDLQYLPNAGTTFGQTIGQYMAGRISSDYTSDLGPKTRTSLSGWSAQQTLGHAVTDRLLLSAAISYADTQFSSAGNKYWYSGWSDPSVAAKYRILDESFRLDLLGSLSINTTDATSGHTYANNHGNNDLNFNGGNRETLGVQVGQKNQSFQYALTVAWEHTQRAKTRTTDGQYIDQAHNSWFTEASVLNSLGEALFLRSHLSARFVEKYSDNNDVTTAPLTDVRAGTQLQYALTRDLLGMAGVEYRSLNINSGFTKDFHMWNWTLGARYQF